MLLIIAHHYVANSGIWEIVSTSRPSANSLFYCIFGMWGKTGINCFVLITGWFMCTSEITLRKFLKLLFEVEFYRIVIGVIFLLTGKETYSSNWLLGLLPVRSISNSFVPSFLVFYLFIPFLNLLVRNMTRKQHLLLASLLFFLYTVLGTVPFCRVTMNYVSWFCALFVFSSFMRLYDFPFKDNNRVWLGLSLLCVLVSVLTVFALLYSGKNVNPHYFVSDSNKLMALVSSICFFNFFRTLKMPYCKFVNIIGATTFGVFLIHTNKSTMRHFLWSELFDNVGHLSDPHYAVRAIGVVLLIFVVCAYIDYLRIILFERPFFRFYDSWIDGKTSR